MSKLHQYQPKSGTTTHARFLTSVSPGVMQRKLHNGASSSLSSRRTGEKTDQLSLEHQCDAPVEHSTVDTSSVQQVLRSSGEPLDQDTRELMEPRFGHNFSDVRVHRDKQAADSARSVNALAYTLGRDIVFGAGQYAPHASDGQKILAHELAHTIQQGSGMQQIPAKLETTTPSDTVEQEAEAAAAAVVQGIAFSPSQAHDSKLARQDSITAPEEGAPSQTELEAKDTPKKSVTVNVTYLKDGSTDIATHLTKANSVFAQASVEAKKGKEETLDETKSKAILGDDLILDEFSTPTTPTTEEKALIKVNRTAATITMYYVKSMSQGSIGEAFYPSSGQTASFVYASSNTRTWPHELGHVLLDTGDHPSDADNFMAQTAVATGKEKMTAAQITKIQSSSFVK